MAPRIREDGDQVARNGLEHEVEVGEERDAKGGPGSAGLAFDEITDRNDFGSLSVCCDSVQVFLQNPTAAD